MFVAVFTHPYVANDGLLKDSKVPLILNMPLIINNDSEMLLWHHFSR
jgi:hypothetical protein